MEPEAHATRRYGLMAAALFFVGAVAGTPTIAFHQPPLPEWTWLLTALAICSGLVCLLVPWERINRQWLHVVASVAAIEVLLMVVIVEPVFCWYYLLVAVYAAYVFPTRAEIAGQLGFTAAVMFAPVVLSLGGNQYPLLDMLVAVPTLVVATAVVVSLREELERGRDAYRLLSRSDALTGVGNYRELRQSLVGEISRHNRSTRRFALILVDLDDFKLINDSLGHLQGDRVLREVGRVLMDSVRPGDTVARHGGDEFSVVAPETSPDEAAALAMRLEQAIPRIVAGENRLGASTGWAVYPEGGQTADELIAAADEALMRDKRGRSALAGKPIERLDPVEVRLTELG